MKCEVMIEDEPIIVGDTQAFAVHIGDEVGLITPETYSALCASSDAENVKEGVRVRLVTDMLSFTVGRICVVGMVDTDDDDLTYRLDTSDRGVGFWCSRDMFEIIPDTEILVGDIVKTNADSVAVVTHVDEQESTAILLFATGYTCKYSTKNLHYTGKHSFRIDEMYAVLKTCESTDEEE